MNEETIKHFMMALGVLPSTIKVVGDSVMGSCPYAPYFHGGGKDTKPSFGIKINDIGKSLFHCFSCGASGTLLHPPRRRRKFLRHATKQSWKTMREMFFRTKNR